MKSSIRLNLMMAWGMGSLAVAGCFGVTQDSTVKPAPPAASPDVRMMADAMLPALYEGVLPCADCKGIRYSLDVRKERVFFLRTTYLGKGAGEGESFDDIGTWAMSPDANKVILRGSRDAPLMFSIENPETLRKLDTAGNPIESTQNYELRRNASYKPLEPRVAMRGVYSYMADAGLFRECLTQLTFPVAQAGDNAALEHAYSTEREQAGQELLVKVDGRIAMQPRMEGSGQQQSLVVERFIAVLPGETCSGAAPSATLENTHWKLVEAGGEPVVTPADRAEAYFRLDPMGNRVEGFAGCNRFSGSYEVEGRTVRFKQVATTMMACADNRNPEARFQQAINGAAAWKITGNQLELLDASGAVLARFEARPPP
jgi:copper homeostasis protein (lipoprotein)